MISQIVSLLVVLSVSSFDRVDAVTCYQCNYTDSACSEPFNATNTATCSGSMCTWKFVNYTSPMSFSLAYRDCVNDSAVMQIDHCEQYSAMFNYTTFRYGESCCYTTGVHGDNDTTYSKSACFCQKDNCNGNIPLTLAPSTKPTNAAMSMLNPSIRDYSTLVVVAVVLIVANFISTG